MCGYLEFCLSKKHRKRPSWCHELIISHKLGMLRTPKRVLHLHPHSECLRDIISHELSMSRTQYGRASWLENIVFWKNMLDETFMVSGTTNSICHELIQWGPFEFAVLSKKSLFLCLVLCDMIVCLHVSLSCAQENSLCIHIYVYMKKKRFFCQNARQRQRVYRQQICISNRGKNYY